MLRSQPAEAQLGRFWCIGCADATPSALGQIFLPRVNKKNVHCCFAAHLQLWSVLQPVWWRVSSISSLRLVRHCWWRRRWWWWQIRFYGYLGACLILGLRYIRSLHPFALGNGDRSPSLDFPTNYAWLYLVTVLSVPCHHGSLATCSRSGSEVPRVVSHRRSDYRLE